MKEQKKVVLIGDSIRMAYQATVKETLGDVAEIISPEENGGDSRNVLAHLDEWVLAHAPQVVHINCGLHDLKKDFDTGQAQVPLEEYADNVRQILSRLKNGIEGIVIWVTTTPVDEILHHKNKGFDRFEADVEAYNAAALAVAKDFDIMVNDLYAVIEEADKSHLLTQDGVHFTAEGSALLGRAVGDCVGQKIS